MLIQHLLDRFSLINAAKWNDGVGAALLLIWLVVLACILSSILSQSFDRAQRIFWMAVVVLLPGVGVLAYLPFAFHKEDMPHMFQRKPRHRTKRKDSATEPDA